MSRQVKKPAADQVTLDELTALCEVMVCLSRAGVPLDRGLVQLARDLPGRLSTQARQISERLEAGQSLADVVSSDDNPFPAVYRGVVEAGLRGGRTTLALESFARVARQIAELRRLVASALVYPMVLMVVVAATSVLLLRNFAATLRSTYASQHGRAADGWESTVLAAFDVLGQWFWVLPVAMILLGVFWWHCTRRASVAEAGRFADWAGWVPGAGRLLRNGRLLTFVEVLHVLVRQQVPLDVSLRLAATASGDRGLQRDARRLADQLQRGELPADRKPGSPAGIPPFLRWNLVGNHRAGQLEANIERARETYRRRAEDAAQWMRTFVPVIFSACFGGVIALLYVGAIFVPWFTLLRSLAFTWGDV